MDIQGEQRLPDPRCAGFDFGEAIQKPSSFDFTSSLPLVHGSQSPLSAEKQTSSHVTLTQDNADTMEEAPSRFAYLYKAKGIKDVHKQRVQESLQWQKQRRYDFLNHVRQLTELVTADEEPSNEETEVNVEKMDWNPEKKSRFKKYKKDLGYFRNQLMFSEWFLEKPERFEEDWLMVPVPKGRRNLVISTNGSTVSYAKNGAFINKFSSHLPGGGRHKHKWNAEKAVLDCIYSESTKTYYILDMMFWKETPMYDTETQFRFYWLHEKLQEVPEAAEFSKQNSYRFEPLPNFACYPENISNVLHQNMNVPIDGFLFYHKETHYTFGDTPLVLWLKPYMLAEALGITVPQMCLDTAPQGYTGFFDFREKCIADVAAREKLEQLKSEQKQKKHRKGKRNESKIQDSSLGEESMQI